MTDYCTFTDQQLTDLLKRGDRHAFDAIYNRYAEPLFRFAYSVLKDEDDCRDAVQDIFIWLWKHKEDMKISFLKSYLFAAVKFNLASLIKQSKRRAEILEFAPKQSEIFEDHALELKELIYLIQEFVGQLPARSREIFELSRGANLTNKEIAKQLNISEKTVENQMTIVLKKLKVSLGKNSFWCTFL
ncbi:RNA polymerase sigma-70 factor [Pedobacter psychroterrae]|uniref:RNA polymerase sigma-70 factor n=1 Tax=Pedobacter psychroterrae TaxID=2530453 RepID=A0A4R0NQA8_9SPHI|nr:RNA polymerase sigma-70 factor [Pedobacter psychroterrae]TCD01254.1 RNA polymerase sigma-70 factor [Pedobacter psychroterrae]